MKNINDLFKQFIQIFCLVDSGISPLAALDYFDVINGFPPEYMHNIAEGVAKKMFKLWTSNTKQPYYLNKNKLSLVNKRLSSIKPIYEIPRKPRPLNSIANFKANEFLAFLLFYLPVCLSGIMPPKYLFHFRTLSASIYSLLQKSISSKELDEIEKNLNKFVDDFETLYGAAHCTMNVHLVKHIVQCTRNFGPIWNFSAFVFESYNGVLLNFVSGYTDVLHQIASKYILSNLVHSGPTTNIDNYDEIIFLGQPKAITEEYLQFKSVADNKTYEFHNIQINAYKRMKIKSKIYTSLMYVLPKTTIDYFVGLQNGILGQIKYYLYMDGNKFALIQQFTKVAEVNHILAVQPNNVNLLVKVEAIQKKYIYFQFETVLFKSTVHFIVEPPNDFETY